jgi:hypothetical protein
MFVDSNAQDWLGDVFSFKGFGSIESTTSPSQDKGKSREQVEMDEGKPEKA